ncbi:MAG: sulfotransferase family 2 domain-containing protein [Acidobacteriota bacterium]
MIFRHHQAIHFHIPKTAGVSVERWLGSPPREARECDREALFGWDPEEQFYLQHATARTVRHLLDDEVFFGCYRFAIVRNPFARLVSAYYYLIDQHRESYGSFASFVRHVPELAAARHGRKGSHFLPQVRYTRIEGRDICDYIAYFERLPLALEPVRRHLGIATQLERHNVFRRAEREGRTVAEHYDAESAVLIRELYREDFEAFGYAPDPRDLEPPAGIVGRWF